MGNTKVLSLKGFRVKDVARMCDLSPNAIRYYAEIGLLQPRRDPLNGYKLFSPSDVTRVLFIRRAKRLGYTLNEIRQVFEESGKGKSSCPLVREIIGRRIQEHRRNLEQAMRLQERMEQALAQWQTMPDSLPDGDSICKLIESFDEGQPVFTHDGHG